MRSCLGHGSPSRHAGARRNAQPIGKIAASKKARHVGAQDPAATTPPQSQCPARFFDHGQARRKRSVRIRKRHGHRDSRLPPGGIGWYARHLNLNNVRRGREGRAPEFRSKMYMDADVWLNGDDAAWPRYTASRSQPQRLGCTRATMSSPCAGPREAVVASVSASSVLPPSKFSIHERGSGHRGRHHARVATEARAVASVEVFGHQPVSKKQAEP